MNIVHSADTPRWLAGGGELGALIRAKDWASTPLGPVARWPQSLRSAISILLPSKAQIALCWGPELVFLYNDAYAPVLGTKHPWALGLPIRAVWSELWEVGLKDMMGSVLATGEAFWATDAPFTMHRRGFVEETYFDISYDPIRDESGEVAGLFCIVSETTGRVVGERRLALLRDLGRVAGEARSVAEVFTQAALVFEANRRDIAFACLLDAQGAPVAAAGVPRACDWPLERLRAQGECVIEGAELERLGSFAGGEWPEPCRAAILLPIAAPGQPPYGYLAAGASPRRPLDESYRDFLRLVASGIAAATAAVRALEEQRAQAQALAELDRAKTAFFSNVSHEFRTPLTLLLGPLQDMLGAPLLGEAQRPALETAQRNARRLQKLVNTLLDFSRIEAGRAQASYAATDLARFTEELASNFRSACEKAGLALSVDCPALSQPVWVDRSMWEKIVLNLLSNALKFTFEGGIAVSLRETAEAVELVVRDSGVGIAPEHLPRLFERFHRIEGVKARTHEGSGIGLAFVRELARLHGGDIAAESEPGRGTRFTVRLPLGTAHLSAERIVAGAAQADAAPAAAAFVEEAMGWLEAQNDAGYELAAADPSTRILVVDDNADMRAYVARLLGARWSVDAATNGRQALELLAERSYDLVLSDVMMPELDGFGLLAEIRARPALAELPVVLLSARAGEEARIDGLAAGADDYIVKPFSAQQLVAQIAAQLKIRQARRAAAQERERQRENLLSLFMKAPNPIVILRGAQYVVELANPPACEVWGRSEAQVLGRPLYEVLPELHDQGFKELLDGVLRSGVAYEGKETPARLRRADGTFETVFFNFVYTPLRDTNGRTDGILVTAFNVTDEVKAREQSSALQAQAEAANRSKDEFLAMLSHELRNPLAAIVASTQLMRVRGEPLPELGTLERQAAHLKRLVDDLLDISRITRGKIELRRRVMELGEAVQRAIEMAAGFLAARAHRIDLSGVPASGLAVEADPDRLAQVVFNLLANAAKYSEPGAPITVRAWRDAGVAKLSVRDQGIGIAAEMIERIFDMFVQQDATSARSEGGLGLGLTIVRSLMALHGGKVSASSAGVGQGAEFTLELPAAAAASSPQPHDAAPEGTRPPRKRVLIVDDNVDAGIALAELVRLLGHEVRLAHDGSLALREAESFPADVALLDIGMPGMDGYELARRLKTHRGPGNGLRLVALSGYGQERDRERSAEAGLHEHLVKPVDLQVLQRLLAS